MTLLFALALASAAAPLGQQAESSDGFDVSDVMIPMRDGVQAAHQDLHARRTSAGPLPIIFKRTPYGIEGAGRQLRRATTRRWPTRATSSSSRTSAASSSPKAQFVMQRPPRDRRATPRRSTRAPTPTTPSTGCSRTCRNNNGRVGMLGVSYDGWLTVMGALEPHPALKAVSPQASPADMWLGDDFHHNGAFRLSYGFEYAAMMESGKDVAAVRVRPLRHLRLVSRRSGRSPTSTRSTCTARSRPGTTSSRIPTTTSSGSARR